MPRSRSSARSCTATNSSQPSSSQSSTQLSYKRSAAGSFSTIKSDPFLHADALDATDPDALDPDSTIQWMPSYYFHDWPQHLSPTHSPRRNALTPSTPTSASQYSSKVSLLPQGLMYLIRSSNLRSQTQQMLLAMVRMIVYISHKLFPTSHVLREDVSRDIKQISQDMCEFLDLVLEKLDQRIVTANAAVDKLSEYQGEDNLPLEEAMQWVEMIRYVLGQKLLQRANILPAGCTSLIMSRPRSFVVWLLCLKSMSTCPFCSYTVRSPSTICTHWTPSWNKFPFDSVQPPPRLPAPTDLYVTSNTIWTWQ